MGVGAGFGPAMTKLPFVICCAGMCNGCRVTVCVELLMALSMNLQLSQHPDYALLPLHCLHKSQPFLTVTGRHMAICIPLLLAENVFCSALSVKCGMY